MKDLGVQSEAVKNKQRIGLPVGVPVSQGTLLAKLVSGTEPTGKTPKLSLSAVGKQEVRIKDEWNEWSGLAGVKEQHLRSGQEKWQLPMEYHDYVRPLISTL